MTLAELSKEVGLSELTLSRNLSRCQKSLERKGIFICKVSKNEFKISKQKFPDIIEIPTSILHMTKYDAAANLCARNQVYNIYRAIEELGWKDTARNRKELKDSFATITTPIVGETIRIDKNVYNYWTNIMVAASVPWEDFIKLLVALKVGFLEDNGEYDTTNHLLCDSTGLSERRLIRAKKALESGGFFKVHRNYEVRRGQVRARPSTYIETFGIGSLEDGEHSSPKS